MESAIPGEIVNACGGFEKDHRLSGWLRCALRYLPRHVGNLQVIQAADKAAFDALGKKVFEHFISFRHSPLGDDVQANVSRVRSYRG